MLSIYAKKSNTNLVVDVTNNGILTSALHVSIANAICFKVVNAEVMVVKLQDFAKELYPLSNPQFDPTVNLMLTKLGKKMLPQSTANIGKIVKSIDNNRRYGVSSMDNVSDEWIERREKVHNLRNNIHKFYSQNLRLGTLGKSFFGDDIFLPYMKKELEKCNPTLHEYTDAIHKWSSLVHVDVAKGFELLLEEVTKNYNIHRNLYLSWSKRCF